MKKLLFVSFYSLIAEIFAPAIHAQGTTYISNLSANPQRSATIASNAWLAQSFRTGNNAPGYSLNSFELSLSAASGSPGNFSVFLYGNNGSHPGNSLERLAGSANPSTAGVFSYMSSGALLSPSTTYWIILTASTPLTSGAYHSRIASFFDYSSINNWSTDRYFNESNDGSNWANSDTGYNLQFAVNATSVPEPSSLTLSGLASLLFATHLFHSHVFKK